MGGWTLFLCAVGLLIGFILLAVDSRRRQHELLQMERMRRSPLYYEIYPLVQLARRYPLDRVQVERDGVTFYGICPPGKIGEYRLTDHGFRLLSRERVRALTLVLAEDLPLLQENSHYRLKKYKVMRPNGVMDDAYLYVIRSHYKTALMYKRQRIRGY